MHLFLLQSDHLFQLLSLPTPLVYLDQYFSQFTVKTAAVIHSEDNRAVSLPSGSILNYPRKPSERISKALIKLSIFSNDNAPITLWKDRAERRGGGDIRRYLFYLNF